jgi:hypothetical protein
MVLLCVYDDDIYISYKERSQLQEKAILTMFIRKNKNNKLYKKLDSLSLRKNVEIYVFAKFFILVHKTPGKSWKSPKIRWV